MGTFSFPVSRDQYLRKSHGKIRIISQEHSDLVADYMAAETPANHKPILKILVKQHEFNIVFSQ